MPSPSIVVRTLAAALCAGLLFLTGFHEGLRRSSRGEPLTLVRDAEDAACLEVLARELAAWPRKK